ncbi:3,4-dihydroxy-2-butanone-4-phosphate synthase [Saccharopolyspora sp. K220]|uniref:3,4-dihydroxy-2-butanone-4-phosphate synthase n=1 Tax=Saccharopolyspora soli TaxID=2926618 RepID=UPI001F5A3A03|nr:3,4-dihydroxy-2-butanone-4-phosphate synthase [Saccharopolyspora soli]MCI2422626.1 3,4-dihydroxy-2-butanone-4-phosphate synthase [Saccharopolyspora soli]
MAAPQMPNGGSTDPASEALAVLRSGRPVLVVDKTAGQVVLPAALATPRWTSWMVRHTSGLLCVPLPAERADRLDLPPMVPGSGAAYAVAVDARSGVSTGISAADRAHTATVLADPETTPDDLTRPGHVLPVRVAEGGLLEQHGHAAAAADLCRLAGLPPVALTATIVHDEGALAHGAEVADLGRRTDLPVLDISRIVSYRHYHGDGDSRRVRRVTQTQLPTRYGRLRAIGYRDEATGAEHLALVSEPAPVSVPLVHVHTECLAGELLGSLRCECSARLDASLDRICSDGGAVVYLRRTRHLGGFETHTTPTCDHGAAAAVLTDLGMTTIRLLPGTATATGLLPGGVNVVGTRTPEMPSPTSRTVSTKERT